MGRIPFTPEERLARKKANDKKYRDTLTPEQLERRRAYQRAYVKRVYDADPEKARAKARTKYHLDPPKMVERVIRWGKANPDKVKAKEARRRQAHPTRVHAWYEANWDKIKDRHNARGKAWAKAHPEYAVMKALRRRARLHNAPVNDVTLAQVRMLLIAAHGTCCYCETYKPNCQACKKGTHKLTVDHITALANGGSHTLINLVACCQSCNSKKHLKPAPHLIQPLLL